MEDELELPAFGVDDFGDIDVFQVVDGRLFVQAHQCFVDHSDLHHEVHQLVDALARLLQGEGLPVVALAIQILVFDFVG